MRASGEGSTHRAFPWGTLVPGTTGLCHLPCLQLQLCCHGPEPSCSLTHQQGSPNSPALVSLASLWLPSHPPPPAFPWTAAWDGQKAGSAPLRSCRMCVAAGYNSPFLSPVYECASVSCASPAASAQPGTGWIYLFKALSLRQSFPPMESEDEIA